MTVTTSYFWDSGTSATSTVALATLSTGYKVVGNFPAAKASRCPSYKKKGIVRLHKTKFKKKKLWLNKATVKQISRLKDGMAVAIDNPLEGFMPQLFEVKQTPTDPNTGEVKIYFERVTKYIKVLIARKDGQTILPFDPVELSRMFKLNTYSIIHDD